MTPGAPRDLSSYLRLSRPASGAWWRLGVAVVAGTVGFFVVALTGLGAVAFAMHLAGRHLDVDTDRISAPLLLATNAGLALCIPLAGALTWAVYGRRPRWLGSVAPGLRRGWLARCLLMAGIVWGVLFVLSVVAVAASDEWTFNASVVEVLLVVVLTTPLQAAGEEYLFRGFLLQSLGATGMRAPVCWVVSALVFATAHGQFAPPLFADRWLIGVVFAWLATTTGGLEASIAIHTVKNVSVLIVAALAGQLSGAVDPHGTSVVPLLLDAVMLAVVGLWIRARSRRETLPPPPPDVTPSVTGSD